MDVLSDGEQTTQQQQQQQQQQQLWMMEQQQEEEDWRREKEWMNEYLTFAAVAAVASAWVGVSERVCAVEASDWLGGQHRSISL